MKRLFACLLCAGVLCVGFAGCADTTEVKKETTVTTPGGTTKTTHETEVERTGSNPPPAAP